MSWRRAFWRRARYCFCCHDGMPAFTHPSAKEVSRVSVSAVMSGFPQKARALARAWAAVSVGSYSLASVPRTRYGSTP